MSTGPDTTALHAFIRFVASLAVHSFFTEVRVIGGENVPKDGPIMVTATHHNMMLDPVILSVGFPYQRMMNYWSKASLFVNSIASWVLYSSGNIPVDRKSKDRQKLFKGTIEALAQGKAVALFPEGTSYTEPRIMQVKDGAAWAAMEYTKWAKENPEAGPKDLLVLPVSIVYTNKSKYRSAVIMEFGTPISLDPYKEQFFSGEEGAPRLAVKRLTHTIEGQLVENTINASDWDTLYAARMARDILWDKDSFIKLEEFVAVSQTLVDLFSDLNVTPNCEGARRHLLEYYSLLESSHLTHSVLSSLPLPRSLDPKNPATIPSRLYTLLVLIRDTLAVVIPLPFFLVPLLIHIPVYVMGRLGARLAEPEEETQAQNKVALGLISLLLIYPATFFFLWSILRYTSIGAIVAGGIVYLFAVSHVSLIDRIYERAKRLHATWRILVGVWGPKGWDLSPSALEQYTQPKIPPPNPWIEHPLTKMPNSDEDGKEKKAKDPSKPNHEEIRVKGAGRRPPSRRLVRHVLRARVEATNALARFFDSLSESGWEKKVGASGHLARVYGEEARKSKGGTNEERPLAGEIGGWRHGGEVLQFLRKRGAKIPSVRQGPMEDDWAASSEGE